MYSMIKFTEVLSLNYVFWRRNEGGKIIRMNVHFFVIKLCVMDQAFCFRKETGRILFVLIHRINLEVKCRNSRSCTNVGYGIVLGNTLRLWVEMGKLRFIT